MQRICRVRGGVNAYLQNPEALVSEQTRQCPFCRDAHLLWLIGWYWRWVVLPASEQPQKIPIRRLYCRHTRQTVSLLPDFCIPRRQHGPAVLGLLVRAYVLGAGLLSALRAARGAADWHSVAQSLLRGFLARAHVIRSYLSQRRHRWVLLPPAIPRDRIAAAELYFNLIDGRPAPVPAFVYHGRCLHRRTSMALA